MGRSGRALSFFELFECQATIAAEGARELRLVLQEVERPREGAARLRPLREDGDIIARRCFEELHVRARTPFDHRAIERLTGSLNAALDRLGEATARLELYRPESVPPEAEALAELLLEALALVEEALAGMRHLRRARDVTARCARIGALVREADRIVRQARARLYREERDPLLLLQWGDVLGLLRAAAVHCQETARTVTEIVLEASG